MHANQQNSVQQNQPQSMQQAHLRNQLKNSKSNLSTKLVTSKPVLQSNATNNGQTSTVGGSKISSGQVNNKNMEGSRRQSASSSNNISKYLSKNVQQASMGGVRGSTGNQNKQSSSLNATVSRN